MRQAGPCHGSSSSRGSSGPLRLGTWPGYNSCDPVGITILKIIISSGRTDAGGIVVFRDGCVRFVKGAVDPGVRRTLGTRNACEGALAVVHGKGCRNQPP